MTDRTAFENGRGGSRRSARFVVLNEVIRRHLRVKSGA